MNGNDLADHAGNERLPNKNQLKSIAAKFPAE